MKLFKCGVYIERNLQNPEGGQLMAIFMEGGFMEELDVVRVPAGKETII